MGEDRVMCVRGQAQINHKLASDEGSLWLGCVCMRSLMCCVCKKKRKYTLTSTNVLINDKDRELEQ